MASNAGIRTLVRRAKNRDQEAFGALYDEYVDPIFRYVYYKVGDFAESQDLTGQTFLKAFENIDSYEMRDVAFSSWLYRICLLYTSDAADDLLCVDLGGRRIIKKKKKIKNLVK